MFFFFYYTSVFTLQNWELNYLAKNDGMLVRIHIILLCIYSIGFYLLILYFVDE